LSDLELEADDDDWRVSHVYPLSEADQHTLAGRECFCRPDVELLEDGKELVIHNRLMQ
jgi:hypothetical protein